MEKPSRFKKAILSILMVSVFVCLTLGQAIKTNATTGKINISMIGKYDSADTATVRSVDPDNKEIRFKNHTTGKTYTLKYDNTSMMYDQYGTVMSARLLEPGQIVDVKFLKSTKIITTLSVSKDAWYIDSTRDHDLVRNDGTAVVKGSVYKIDPRTMVLADNKPALTEDVLSTDSVVVSGIGKEIYSVIVSSGHGYVSLSSDTVENTSLVGAWIELDNDVIRKITSNMLLSAPEGDYKLQIIGNGANYQSNVNVSRNQETVIDTSDINIAKPKEGLITFEIVPDNADVFVDGQRMLTGVPQTVQYGYHNLKIMADGYETQSKYLKVGTPKSVISIELEKTSSASSEDSTEQVDTSTDASTLSASQDDGATESTTQPLQVISSNSASTEASKTVSGNSSGSSNNDTNANRVIDGCKVYFDAPYGAEVYFDGGYVGMVPTNVVKISGNHEIILKMDGYETKSYRIHIDTSKTDLEYKFPDLVKIENEDASSAASTAKSDASNASSAASSGSSDSSSDASSGSSDGSSDASSAASSDDSGSAASSDSSSASDSSSDASSEASSEGSSEAPGESTGEGSSDDSSSKEQTNGSSDTPAESTTAVTNEEESDAASTASASTEG